MKDSRLYIILLIILLFGCTDYPKYDRSIKSVMPDSLKEKQSQFVIEAVRAASYHMTGGDYEDPEDVIEQANETFIDIYSTDVEGLVKYNCHGCYGLFTPINELTPEELKIYNSIK